MPQFGVNISEPKNVPGLTDALAELIGEIRALSQEPYRPYVEPPTPEFPQGKPIPRLAPFSDKTLRAHELGSSGEYVGGSSKTSSRNHMYKGAQEFPEHFERYMDPYKKQVIDMIRDLTNRNFTENLLPSLEAQFVGQGAYGGERHRELAARALRDTNESIAREAGRALSAGYSQAGNLFEQDRQRHMEAARQWADLSRDERAQHLSNIAVLESQGRAQQEQKQADLNMQYENFLREQQHPTEVLGRQSNILHGIPMSTGQTTYTQNPLPPQPSTASNIASMLSNLAGISAMHQKPMKEGGGIRISKRLLRQMGI